MKIFAAADKLSQCLIWTVLFELYMNQYSEQPIFHMRCVHWVDLATTENC